MRSNRVALTLGAQVVGPELIRSAPGVVRAVGDNLPTRANAARNFDTAMTAARDVPIDVAEPGNVALDAQRLANSGASLPVVKDFIKRTTDPNQAPLTYAEARDFYSNASRLSASEYSKLSPVMQRQLGNFTAALGRSIQGAADQAGVGDQYAQAMSQYRTAARVQNAASSAGDLAKRMSG